MAARAWLLLALLSGPALAHPLDEVVQGAYLTLAHGEVRLELDITPGPKVAGALLQALDTHGDRVITEDAARAYAQGVLQLSTLALDDVAVTWSLQGVIVPPYQNLALAGDTIKIYGVAKGLDRAGVHTLRYENHYQPAPSQWIANVFLQPGAGWRYEVTAQQHSDDGALLIVSYTVAPP